MSEIRRIIDDGAECERVVELWDRSCRETPDGGPLSTVGRRNLARMLAMQAWHRESFCLVADLPERGIVGYVWKHDNDCLVVVSPFGFDEFRGQHSEDFRWLTFTIGACCFRCLCFDLWHVRLSPKSEVAAQSN